MELSKIALHNRRYKIYDLVDGYRVIVNPRRHGINMKISVSWARRDALRCYTRFENDLKAISANSGMSFNSIYSLKIVDFSLTPIS